MEQLFAHDFADVRVHTDVPATAALNARAYTIGEHVVFGAAEYAPETVTGRRLLAHELAHVVQQSARPHASGPLRVSRPGDAGERAADEAVRDAFAGAARHGAGSGVHERLLASAPSEPIVQRSVKTWGGEFDTDKFKGTRYADGEVEMVMDLRFKPGVHANATKIGLVQAASGKDTGKPERPRRFARKRAIPADQPGGGTFIDTLGRARNPLYATRRAHRKDTLASTPTDERAGRHGWHYHDKRGKLQERDALLFDRPSMPSSGPDSEQVFETAAVAVEGVQAGTYYGSVRWGWMIDAQDEFCQIGLEPVSTDVPSPVFAAAAARWNEGTNRWGKQTIDLPSASLKYIDAPDARLVGDPAEAKGTPPQKLETGTQVIATVAAVGTEQGRSKVTVVDGPHAGMVGWVPTAILADQKKG
jgi:hypothetical protein